MAMAEKDRKQLMVLLIILGAAAPLYYWFMPHQTAVTEVQDLRAQIDSLDRQVRAAQADLRQGSVDVLRRRVDAYERSLALMRQLVPASNEVTTLLDAVSTRAQVRGVQTVSFDPLSSEFQPPFEVQRFRMTVQGYYDDLGQFFTDVASLPQIIVPQDVSIGQAGQVVGEDVSPDDNRAYLQATFMLKTFVKTGDDPLAGGTGGTP